jgi:hypothetical protein
MSAWKLLKEWFTAEPDLSPEDRAMQEWAEAVQASNWVRLHQMRMTEDLDYDDFFDRIAMAYSYCYAAKVEPVRDADWTAFRKTLENLHYPALAEAITIRNKKEQ